MNRNSAAFSKKERKFQDKVLERDLYLCQCCGELDDLQVHHIQPVNMFPDLSFDIDNGVTLCKECHNKYHHSYGVKNECNEKTFKNFIDSSRQFYNRMGFEINWNEGLINKPNRKKTKKDFLVWSLSILQRCSDVEEYLLIQKIFEFYVTHDIKCETLDSCWDNFLHNNYGDYDGSIFWNNLFTLRLESEVPFLLINNESYDILGVYNKMYFDLKYNSIYLFDIHETQYLTDKEVSDLINGKYEFISLLDIKKKQFDEVKQEKLWDCMLRRILNSFRRG